MRLFIATSLLACLLLVSTASGQGMGPEGQIYVGGYVGYGIGIGDPFVDEVWGSFEAGFGYGGTLHYGLNDMIIVGGEFGSQRFTTKNLSSSNSKTETNFLFSGLYGLNYQHGSAVFLAFGGGLYGFEGGSEFGINSGFLYRKEVSEVIFIYVMPRVHLIFAEKTLNIMQISLGIQIPLGG